MLPLFLGQPGVLRPDPPIKCGACEDWNRPVEPFRIYGNSYYVGTAGLSALLVTGDAGHVLLDAALPQSAARIDANIRKLGFRTEDVRLILVSHGHFDHAGGVAAMQRASGATVAVSESTAAALRRGENTPDDPQFAFGKAVNGFPPVTEVRVVRDAEVSTVGALALTAHYIPGHTPGSTAWTWQSCEGTTCLRMVYADSLTAVSAPGFRYGPGLETFRRSIERVAALPCDVIVSPHPAFTNMEAKLNARARSPTGPNPFVDPKGCRSYAATAMRGLEARRAAESQAGR
jgi:metallo-beta-lactamase class B